MRGAVVRECLMNFEQQINIFGKSQLFWSSVPQPAATYWRATSQEFGFKRTLSVSEKVSVGNVLAATVSAPRAAEKPFSYNEPGTEQ